MPGVKCRCKKRESRGKMKRSRSYARRSQKVGGVNSSKSSAHYYRNNVLIPIWRPLIRLFMALALTLAASKLCQTVCAVTTATSTFITRPLLSRVASLTSSVLSSSSSSSSPWSSRIPPPIAIQPAPSSEFFFILDATSLLYRSYFSKYQLNDYDGKIDKPLLLLGRLEERDRG